MSSVRKGTGFELRVAELFRQRGYLVTHNVRKTGRSGAAHQIDVLAQFGAPLHTSTVIVEAKSHAANIDKDTVMKLIHVMRDLSADRAVLATTSGFTSGAMRTARQYGNVELWDGARMESLLGEVRLDAEGGDGQVTAGQARMIGAEITLEDVRQSADEAAAKRSRGGWLGMGKVEERVRAVTRFLYPYYDVEVGVKARRVESTGWFSTEEVVSTASCWIWVDGNTGSVVHAADGGISYGHPHLGMLSADEISILRRVAGEKEFEKRSLSATGWTVQRINRAVGGLTEKGLLVQTALRPATYEKAAKYPGDPSVLASLTDRLHVTELTDDRRLEGSRTPAEISAMLEGLWPGVSVRTVGLVYYPYYMEVYERPDGSTRYEITDGVSGSRQEYLEGVVSEDTVCGGRG